MYKESVFEDPEYIKLTTISSFVFFLSEGENSERYFISKIGRSSS